MPQMGDSVAEGTILEWHKREGDHVEADETLVDISTDKVDAEVPAGVSGTVVRLLAAEGDTVAVGSVLAEIAPANGSVAPTGGNGGAPAAEAPAPEADVGEAQTLEIVMPQMGESVTEGVVLEWHKGVGDAIAADETLVEISTDKVDAEVPAPASGTVTELLVEPGETVTVGQVLARMSAGAGAAAAASQAAPTATNGAAAAPSAPPPRRPPMATRTPPRSHAAPPRPTASRSKASPAAARAAASRRTTCWRSPTGPPRPHPPPRSRPARSRSRAARRCSRDTWTTAARSRRRRRSAHLRCLYSTRDASSSRKRASRSPSRT